MSPPICPCCGYSLERDEPVEAGDWRIVPGAGVFYRGERVLKRETWTQILLALAKLEGRLMTTPALLARISDSESNNVLASQISQLREALKDRGITPPIEGHQGPSGGYRWSALQ